MGKAWTQSDEDRALIAYVRAVILAEPLQLAILEKHGVRLAGLRALRVLRDLGTVPISRFAEALAIPRSTATGVVDRLAERGLIERTFDTADRRTIRIGVTPRGLAALEDRTLVDESAVGERIRALAPEEQSLLADLLERVVGDGAIAAARAPEPARAGH
ncbi:MAG: MarR family transcriptional regulator [Thermomicrobia bacterium]|nr:MarR family transcriptional regulator [Thermomicrobia bacterium]